MSKQDCENALMGLTKSVIVLIWGRRRVDIQLSRSESICRKSRAQIPPIWSRTFGTTTWPSCSPKHAGSRPYPCMSEWDGKPWRWRCQRRATLDAWRGRRCKLRCTSRQEPWMRSRWRTSGTTRRNWSPDTEDTRSLEKISPYHSNSWQCHVNIVGDLSKTRISSFWGIRDFDTAVFEMSLFFKGWNIDQNRTIFAGFMTFCILIFTLKPMETTFFISFSCKIFKNRDTCFW